MDLKGRDFLTLRDYTPEEISYLVELSGKLKARKKQGIAEKPLRGKNVALIFEKTRPRQLPDGQEGEHRRYGPGAGENL